MHVAIPAATLILLRDVPGGPPEIPMVSRGAHMAFAANRRVFPGGRVDEDDRLLAARPDLIVEGPTLDSEELAHRIAAIRETIEEIGLAPGIRDLSDVHQLAAIRNELHAGHPLSLLLERHWLRLDPHGILPFARWRPDHELARRFDARFYVAKAPELGEATADGIESVQCVWATAEAHLAQGELIFPTISNLEWIAQVRDFADAADRAARYLGQTITPRVEIRDNAEWLCIPKGLGYPVTERKLSDADRGAHANIASTTRAPG